MGTNTAYTRKVASWAQINSPAAENFRARILKPESFCHQWALLPTSADDERRVASAIERINAKMARVAALQVAKVSYDEYFARVEVRELAEITEAPHDPHVETPDLMIQPTDFVDYPLSVYTQEMLSGAKRGHSFRLVRSTDTSLFKSHVASMDCEGDTRLSLDDVFLGEKADTFCGGLSFD